MIFTSKRHVSHTSSINTTDGSQLHVNLTETVATPNLSLPATFHILKLIINLIYVGQLCDLGLNVIFFSSGCHVHDLQIGQIIKICRKVGCIFELIHLSTLPTSTVVSTSSVYPLSLWHS